MVEIAKLHKIKIKRIGQQAYAWVTGKLRFIVSLARDPRGFHHHHHPASIAQKLALPRRFYWLLYGYIWKLVPLPILVMSINQNKVIISQYKMATRKQYLSIANSDRAIRFPSYNRKEDEITFFVPNNEKGEPSKWAMRVPVVAYRDLR